MRSYLNKITAGDIIIAGIIFLISSALIAHSFISPSGGTARIFIDNKLVDEVNLKTDNTYQYQGVVSPIIVEVSGGNLRVIDSGCPLRLCIKRGKISRLGESVVCLPNRFIAVISDGEESSVDGVTE